jgi:hypothetical protein
MFRCKDYVEQAVLGIVLLSIYLVVSLIRKL